MQRWSVLLPGLFLDRLYKIVVERACNLVEPTPILHNQLKNNGAAAAPDADFVTGETVLPRKTDRLRSPQAKSLAALILRLIGAA